MSKLSRFISAHIETAGLQQKDFATAFFDALSRRVGEHRAGKWDTVPPKLSKFLKGEVEGERFFTEDDERRRSLADALRLSEQEVDALRAARSLVLDPRLPEQVRTYLNDAGGRPHARHDCVEVDSTVLSELSIVSRSDADRLRLRMALRVVADANHGCLLVLQDFDDRLYFEGAQIDVTRVTEHPRGWILASSPDLVPLPPPPEPKRCDPDTGPLLRAPELIDAVRSAIQCVSNRYTRERSPETPFTQTQLGEMAPRLAAADRLGAELTFRVNELAPWLAQRDGVDSSEITWCVHGAREKPALRPAELAARCFEEVCGTLASTVVWNQRERLFAIGPRVAQVRAMLARDHEVHTPECLGSWRHAVANWNPWRTLPPPERYHSTSREVPSDRWRSLSEEMVRQIGVDIGDVVEQWRVRAEPDPLPAEPWEVAFDAGEEARCRAVVVELLNRQFALTLEQTHYLFELRLVSEASVLPLPRGPRDRCHFAANVGAGHMLRVRVLEYPQEERLPIRPLRGGLDGGDLHILLDRIDDDVLLEASAMPAIMRREREAIAAAKEAARDWDDD